MRDLEADVGNYTERIVDLLWPGAEFPAKGRSPQGGLIALPSARRPRLLVPAVQPRAAASAVLRYNVRPDRRTRATNALLAAGLRTGLVQLAGRQRSWFPGGTAQPDGITAQLREIVSPGCEVAVYLGIPRANRKPVLLALEPDGALSAVAKLGVSTLSRRLVRNETAALHQLAAARLQQLAVPRVLFSGEWRGCELLVQTALPAPGKAPADAQKQRDLAAVEISGVGGLEVQRLASSPVLARLAERIMALPDGVERSLASGSLSRLREAVPDEQLLVGSWHGDWTPWNVAARQSGGVLAWDWERFVGCVPAGYDALHYRAQRGARSRGGPGAALANTRADVDALLGPFGVAFAARQPVLVLYLIELLVRYTEDGQARLPIGRRWIDALTECLRSLMTDLARPNLQQRNLS